MNLDLALLFLIKIRPDANVTRREAPFGFDAMQTTQVSCDVWFSLRTGDGEKLSNLVY